MFSRCERPNLGLHEASIQAHTEHTVGGRYRKSPLRCLSDLRAINQSS